MLGCGRPAAKPGAGDNEGRTRFFKFPDLARSDHRHPVPHILWISAAGLGRGQQEAIIQSDNHRLQGA